jgi:catechol 2,3-dioxygenase-like lactoylglutathione lyase family enzyme
MTPPDPRTAITSIGQICVNAHDLPRAVRFYQEALGLRLLFQVPRMAFFQCGEVRLMLGLPEKPEFDHPSSILYFRVEDIAGAHAAMTRHGVRFEAAPHVVHRAQDHELWLAFFKDSEGNQQALMSEVR